MARFGLLQVIDDTSMQVRRLGMSFLSDRTDFQLGDDIGEVGRETRRRSAGLGQLIILMG